MGGEGRAFHSSFRSESQQSGTWTQQITPTHHTPHARAPHIQYTRLTGGGEGVLEIAFRLRQVKQLVELSQQPYNHLPPPTESNQ